MPILSNGHLAVQLMGHNVYMNGIYNGERGLSHRARIPNYSNLVIDPDQINSFSWNISYHMNYRLGLFETVIQLGHQFTIRHVVYVHRYYTRAIVNEIILKRLEGSQGTILLQMSVKEFNLIPLINFLSS